MNKIRELAITLFARVPYVKPGMTEEEMGKAAKREIDEIERRIRDVVEGSSAQTRDTEVTPDNLEQVMNDVVVPLKREDD